MSEGDRRTDSPKSDEPPSDGLAVLNAIDRLRRELSGYHGQLVAHNCLQQHCDNQRKRIGELEALYAATKAERDEWKAKAATLGKTCNLHDCEGSFSSTNLPVWRCDCGAFMTSYTDATTYHRPRHCPNCGAKAVWR